MKKPLFEGVATAIVTPFNDDATEVDTESFSRLVGYQLENQADALVVCGTTGESPVLTKEEKLTLFSEAVRLCDTRIPVIAGTGSNNTLEAVKKSNEAEKMGVNGLLIVTPYYNKCTQEGLIRHYEYIAQRVSTPIIVYNVPSRTGVTIKAETYEELAKIKNIVAVKEASGNLDEFAKTTDLCKERLDFYSGNDENTVDFIKLGGKGVISVAGNIIPGVMHTISDLASKNETEKADALLKNYIELIRFLFCEVNPIPVKYACSMLFDISNSLRLPLTTLSQKNSEEMMLLFKQYGLI